MCCFRECCGNRREILAFHERIEERYMWHPSSEVPVVNSADGLDRRLHGFWWDEDDCCGVGFVWHIVNGLFIRRRRIRHQQAGMHR